MRKVINKGWTWFSLLLMLHAVEIIKSVVMHYNIVIICLITFEIRKVTLLISEYKKNQTFWSFDYLSSFVDSMLILILVDTIGCKSTGNENEFVPSANYQLRDSTK